jgi:hypothetical protein
MQNDFAIKIITSLIRWLIKYCACAQTFDYGKFGLGANRGLELTCNNSFNFRHLWWFSFGLAYRDHRLELAAAAMPMK